jgi:hypothetical protein
LSKKKFQKTNSNSLLSTQKKIPKPTLNAV